MSLDLFNLTSENETLVSEITLEYLNDEETKRRSVPLIYLGILSLLGIPGNLLILYVYIIKFEKKAVHRTFVIALAMTDFLVCSFAIPFEIAQMTREYTFELEWLCKFGRTMRSFLTLSSAMILVALSGNRYRRICHPIQSQLNYCHALFCIVAIYCVCLLFALPEVALSGIMLHELPNNLTGKDCSDSHEHQHTDYPTIYSSLKLVLFSLCMVMLLIMCILIGRQIVNHEKFCDQFKLANMVYAKKDSKSCLSTSMCIGRQNKYVQESVQFDIEHDNPIGGDKSRNAREHTSVKNNIDNERWQNNESLTRYIDTESCKHTIHRKAKSSRHKLDSPRKITKTALAVSICFIIVFLPYAIIKLLGAVRHGDIIPPSPWVSALLPTFSRTQLVNNISNFFIYLRLDLAFRRHCKTILCHLFRSAK